MLFHFQRYTFCIAFLASVIPAQAQLPVTLNPQSIEQFDAYSRKIEQQLSSRWRGPGPFLSIDDSPEERNKVLGGETSIRAGTPDNPVELADSLVHDWIGDVFFPDTTMQKVLTLLQDFDRHSTIYPEITKSRLLRREGNHITGYWRLEKTDQVIPVVLDVIDEAEYEQVGPGKWICRAYAKNVTEVENAGSEREKKLPVGRGNGFLWRLYAYWSLQAINGGVLGECRTLSLSRNVPPGLGWMVKPFIKNLPRESLSSTLRATRSALMQ